jgi:hypothetical protein
MKAYPYLMADVLNPHDDDFLKPTLSSVLMVWNFIRIILKAFPSLVADVLYPHDDDVFLNLIPSSWSHDWWFETS